MRCPDCGNEIGEDNVIMKNDYAITYECSNCRLRISFRTGVSWSKVRYKKEEITVLRYPYGRYSWADLNSDELKALYDDSEKVIFT